MTEKKYCVYIHTNKANNKRYIGMTSLQPKERWQGGSGYSTQERFWKDIQEYGWDGFLHEVIYDGLSKEEAQIKESELIILYKTYLAESGYNKYQGKAKLKSKRKILCIELDKAYKSTVQASKDLHIDSSSIAKCCRGERKTAGGYHWKYIEVME